MAVRGDTLVSERMPTGIMFRPIPVEHFYKHANEVASRTGITAIAYADDVLLVISGLTQKLLKELGGLALNLVIDLDLVTK